MQRAAVYGALGARKRWHDETGGGDEPGRRGKKKWHVSEGKPMFIDKPVSASLEDTLAIYAIANKLNVPIFSSSSLRWASGAQAARRGELG